MRRGRVGSAARLVEVSGRGRKGKAWLVCPRTFYHLSFFPSVDDTVGGDSGGGGGVLLLQTDRQPERGRGGGYLNYLLDIITLVSEVGDIPHASSLSFILIPLKHVNGSLFFVCIFLFLIVFNLRTPHFCLLPFLPLPVPIIPFPIIHIFPL